MKTKLILTAVVSASLLAVPLAGFAQDQAQEAVEQQDQGLRLGWNGNFWTSLANDANGQLAKLFIVRGIYEGLLLANLTGANQNYFLRVPTDVDYEEIIASVDQFYTDGENQPVYIVHALTAIRMKRDGATDEQVQGYLNQFTAQAQTAPTAE